MAERWVILNILGWIAAPFGWLAGKIGDLRRKRHRRRTHRKWMEMTVLAQEEGERRERSRRAAEYRGEG